jgi:hypothetical protein
MREIKKTLFQLPILGEIIMELKIAADTDLTLWDGIVQRSQNGTLFHTWKWLKLMEKHAILKKTGMQLCAKLYPVMLMEKNTPVGIYPIFIFKTPLINYCYSPPSFVETIFLGPLFPDIDTMKQEKKQIFLHDIQILIDRFIKKDQKANYVQINMSPGYEDCRSFKWAGYNVEPEYTYHIDLSIGTDQIWKSFNRSLRYYIGKAKNDGITIAEGNKEDAFYLYDLLKKRKRINSPKEFIGDAFDQFFPDHIKVFIAMAGSERLSGIIIIIHRDKVSFWVGAPRYSYKGLSPNELVLWESIRWAGEHGYKIFEIVGADDYSLFPFKRKFNGKIISYYRMTWMSPSLKLVSSLYHALKKGDDNQFGV